MKFTWKYKIAKGLDLIRHDPKTFITLLFYPILSTRPVTRGRRWFKILGRLREATTKFEIALVFSAIIDTIVFTFHRRSALSPKSYFTGIVLSKKFGCSWVVRAGTDDIYSIMPQREKDACNVILNSLKEGDILIDVGASIGYYTVLASNLVGAEGAVIALEPMPGTFQCLEINCKLNHLTNVTLIPKAAWSNECTMPIFVSGGYYGMASITEAKGDSTSVQAIPLDTVCEPYSHIKMIKIDAEGAEYQILCGAGLTLKKTKYLVIECGHDYDRIVNLLERSSFNIRKLAFTTYILAERKSISKKNKVV